MLRYNILRYEQLGTRKGVCRVYGHSKSTLSELHAAHTQVGRGTPYQGCALVLFYFRFSYSCSNAVLNIGVNILRNVGFFNATIFY
jgi:hypothetical protein